MENAILHGNLWFARVYGRDQVRFPLLRSQVDWKSYCTATTTLERIDFSAVRNSICLDSPKSREWGAQPQGKLFELEDVLGLVFTRLLGDWGGGSEG